MYDYLSHNQSRNVMQVDIENYTDKFKPTCYQLLFQA